MTYRGTIFDLNRERENSGLAPHPTGMPPQPELPLVSNYIQPTDYPTGQKIALLLLRKGELANDLVNRLRAMGADVTGADWRVMIEHGRIARRDGRLQLTPMGLHAAQEIARDLARKFTIHSITRRRGIGNRGPSVNCTCGFSTYSSNMNGNALERDAVEHLQQAKNGTLPGVYRFGEERLRSEIAERAKPVKGDQS